MGSYPEPSVPPDPQSAIHQRPNGTGMEQQPKTTSKESSPPSKVNESVAVGSISNGSLSQIDSRIELNHPVENDGFPFYAKDGELSVAPTDQPVQDADLLSRPISKSILTNTQSAAGTFDRPSTKDSERPERKSISFARPAVEPQDQIQDAPDAQDTATTSPNESPKSRISKFMPRMWSLGPQSQNQSSTFNSPSKANQDSATSGTGAFLSQMTRSKSSRDRTGDDTEIHDPSDDEAWEDSSTPRKRQRVRQGGTQTAPTTPKKFAFPPEALSTPPGAQSEHRPFFSIRRSSSQDALGSQLQGASEDEGRSRLDRSSWRRRSSAWVHGVCHPSQGQNVAQRTTTQDSTTEPVRPSHLRRITGIGTNTGTADASPSTWRIRSEQGAQKWRQIRANLKLIGRERRKAANRLDHTKSAELVAELLAGSPAALILASKFQLDEGKRIPVLLEQLKISITDSQVKEGATHERNPIFRIELEYGSGLVRMKWTIHRSLRDFWGLHGKYAAEASLLRFQRHRSDDTSRVKLPRFPRTAFPYFRDFRGLADDNEEEEEEETGDDGNDTDGQTTDRTSKQRRRRSSIAIQGRRSSGVRSDSIGALSPSGEPTALSDPKNVSSTRKGDRYAERSRKKLEVYLRNLVRFVIFRPGSNRMCRFLELSALGIRLAVEGGYHGKEGKLMLQSGKGVDFRRAWVPELMIQRHRPMWFLVRHSYIVCVDSPADMNIYDVFLVDGDFAVTPKRPRIRDQKKAKDIAKTAGHAARHPQHHTLRIMNSERRLRLVADSERQMSQFEDSIRFMAENTEWSKQKRFGSFAPVRKNVFAQWLVDGRDYMWNLSRALSMARDVIYIHGWWLSPELFMRRPGSISHKWRLDRILKKKAEEGVKIFVIVYRNINSAIPIDSEYTKFALLDLHPNIFVQRSPNQVRQNVFFWAHHEKLCIIDHTIVFCGGIDLCFGRWDTPSHSMLDDRPTGWEPTDMPLNADTCQLWPGKDYSNPRVLDFFKLDEPFGEMYDRTRVPRMPWHDVGVQIVGQPARDMTRHFVQRWNYILRQRKPSRPTPFLLPPPDFRPGDLEALGLEGTCTVQMLRSAGDWSLGTQNRTEHSILNAYCKLIEASEHFVYLENQFFITSCMVEGTRVHNSIGDALVERIIRAHKNDEDWLAILLIPLMPGFQNTVDAQDGTSVRLIMQCQYRSICRGSTSIFERLRSEGVNPEDYISFYSLRTWGKIGPTKALVSEQLYIHAKCMVVDDRHAIIGSANINERSMLGDRDSEVAAVIFDTDMIDSVMGGESYKVGRFPHTLRTRLMREHLGLDVDHIMEADRDDTSSIATTAMGDESPSIPSSSSRSNERVDQELIAKALDAHTFNHDADWEEAGNPHLKTNKPVTSDPRVTNTIEHKLDVDGFGIDNMQLHEGQESSRGRDTILVGGREVMVNDVSAEGRGTIDTPSTTKKDGTKHTSSVKTHDSRGTLNAALPPPRPPRLQTLEMGLTLLSQLPPLPMTDDTDIGGPPLQRSFSQASADAVNPILTNMRRPVVEKDCMRDPLNDSFFRDTWNAVAKNNTRLYRQVFRCMPDNEVTNWTQYNAAIAYSERFAQSQGMAKGNMRMQQEAHGKTGPPGHGIQTTKEPVAAAQAKADKDSSGPQAVRKKLSGKFRNRAEGTSEKDTDEHPSTESKNGEEKQLADSPGSLNEKDDRLTPDSAASQADLDAQPARQASVNDVTAEDEKTMNGDQPGSEAKQGGAQRRRRRATTKSSGPPRPSDALLSKSDAEELMKLVQGNLVEWPYDWLCQEERGGKWLYSVDQMAPMEIYD